MTRRQQEFLAPGTWTCPPTTTRVELFMVGGGGGGIGGGGGVRVANVAVDGPQPVTIGAGGPGTSPSGAQAGGTTTFGPGPAPLASVGGGGVPGTAAPTDGGGAGEGNHPGGSYGYPGAGAASYNSGASPGAAFLAPGVGMFVTPSPVTFVMPALGYNGFGQGGGETFGRGYGTNRLTFVFPVPATYYDGKANTGGGGSSGAPSGTTASGGSGYLIVRWFE